MTIPLVKESDDLRKEFGILERCHFCKIATQFWHENTNNPVCHSCATKHKVKELPDHGQTIRANKRNRRYKLNSNKGS